MRVLSYLLILAGLLFIGDAAYDEYRGVADAFSPGRGTRRHVIARADDATQFRNLMTYQWMRGPVFILGGFSILGICHRADRLDPLSPDFGGSQAVEDLERKLAEEEQARSALLSTRRANDRD